MFDPRNPRTPIINVRVSQCGLYQKVSPPSKTRLVLFGAGVEGQEA